MRRSKKLIIAAVVAAVILAGSIGGVALAQDNGDGTGPAAKFAALWDRVGEIYQQKTGDALDQEALKEALAEAQSEMRDEAMKTWLESLVEEGRITQGEADQYLEWWQSKPDVSIGFGSGGRGGFRGMGGPRGFLGPYAPVE
jgi:hypothetical protein